MGRKTEKDRSCTIVHSGSTETVSSEATTGSGRPRMVQDPVRLAIDHEREDTEALRELAEDRDTSVAELVRAAVRAYVKRQQRR